MADNFDNSSANHRAGRAFYGVDRFGWGVTLPDMPDLAEIMVNLPRDMRDPIRSTIAMREVRQAFLDNNGGVDWITQLKVQLERMDIDHVIPHSWGGGHDLRNFKPTDFVTNRKRGNDLGILVERKIGIVRDADNFLVPDESGRFMLFEHNGDYLNVQRLTLDQIAKAGIHAGMAGIVLEAVGQGWEWRTGRRDRPDFEALARAGVTSGLAGVTTSAVRTAIVGYAPIASFVASPMFVGAGVASAPLWVPVVVTVGATAVTVLAAATVSSVATEVWDQTSTAVRTRDVQAFDLRDLGSAAIRPTKTAVKVARHPILSMPPTLQRRWQSVTRWRPDRERVVDGLLEGTEVALTFLSDPKTVKAIQQAIKQTSQRSLLVA